MLRFPAHFLSFFLPFFFQVPAPTTPERSHAALETPTSDSPWVRQEPSIRVPMEDMDRYGRWVLKDDER